MTWITDNKGAGPWDFIPQGEKCGYVNNPRWTANRASDIDHEPCGYWPKQAQAGQPVNLYGITTSGNGAIWRIYYDRNSLAWRGSYEPPDKEIRGLQWFGNNLLTVAGEAGTAVLRQIDSTTMAKVADYSVLNSADWPASTDETNILYAPELNKYFVIGASSHGRILRFSASLAREARGSWATVTVGTDGHLYLLKNDIGSWLASGRPVTGGSWSTYWVRIDDDIFDGPIIPWGTGSYIASASGGIPLKAFFAHGYLYVMRAGTIFKINPSTLETEAFGNFSGSLSQATLFGSTIYVMTGTTNATVKSFRTNNLSAIATSVTLPVGRAAIGGMTVNNGFLWVVTAPYVADSAFYRLDPVTLAILDYTVINSDSDPFWHYNSLYSCGGTDLVATHTNNVSIFREPGLVTPADSSAVFGETASPPSLRLLNYSYAGYTTRDVLVGIDQDAPSGLIGSPRCGTSPVWPMPA